MATTMKLIGKTTLGSNASTVTLDSIPSQYTDLYVVMSCRTNGSNANEDLLMRVNGDTGNAYSHRTIYGNGASAASGSNFYGTDKVFVGTLCKSTDTSNTFSITEVYIPNYAGSANKSISATSAQESNGTTAYVSATAGLWSSTAAITSLTFLISAGSVSFVTNSSFYLYGITKS